MGKKIFLERRRKYIHIRIFQSLTGVFERAFSIFLCLRKSIFPANKFNLKKFWENFTKEYQGKILFLKNEVFEMNQTRIVSVTYFSLLATVSKTLNFLYRRHFRLFSCILYNIWGPEFVCLDSQIRGSTF